MRKYLSYVPWCCECFCLYFPLGPVNENFQLKNNKSCRGTVCQRADGVIKAVSTQAVHNQKCKRWQGPNRAYEVQSRYYPACRNLS